MSDTEILIEFDADTTKFQTTLKETIKITEMQLDYMKKSLQKSLSALKNEDPKDVFFTFKEDFANIAKLEVKLEKLKAAASKATQEIQKVSQSPVSGTTLNFFERLNLLAQTTRERISNLSQTIWQNLGNATRNASTATSGLNTHLSYTMNRLLNIARSAFFFNIFSRSIRALSREMLTLVERD